MPIRKKFNIPVQLVQLSNRLIILKKTLSTYQIFVNFVVGNVFYGWPMITYNLNNMKFYKTS